VVTVEWVELRACESDSLSPSEGIDEVVACHIPLDPHMGPRIMHGVPIKNVIKLDDSTDIPDGKVLVVSNEIRIHIVPAAASGKGVGDILKRLVD
jgi:hypothetical protein